MQASPVESASISDGMGEENGLGLFESIYMSGCGPVLDGGDMAVPFKHFIVCRSSWLLFFVFYFLYMLRILFE